MLDTARRSRIQQLGEQENGGNTKSLVDTKGKKKDIDYMSQPQQPGQKT